MKKENRTISAFRRLLMAALCCVLPVAASAQTGKNTTAPASDARVYYLPLGASGEKTEPEKKTTEKEKNVKKKSDKGQKTTDTPKADKKKAAKTETVPAAAKKQTAKSDAATAKTAKKDTSTVKKPKRTAAKAAADTAAVKKVKPEKAKKDSATVKTAKPATAKKDTSTVKKPKRTAAKAASDTTAVKKVKPEKAKKDTAAAKTAKPATAKKDTSTVKKPKRTAAKAAADTAVVKGTMLSASNASVQPAVKRHFMPTRRRIDREVEKNKFVYKGETMMGLTISYGTLNTDNADMFPIFDEINVDGSIVTLNPYIGYFYRDNNCFGVRFGYSHVDGTLDSFGVNLGEENDIELDIPWIDLSSRRFSASAFHRTYVGLDEKCRFGAFGELELSYTNGDNMFAYKSGDRLKHTRSKSQSVRVLFSPGVAVYALPNVSASVSFGLGGFKYTFTQQYDENDAKTGKRHYSNLNFRLNLLDIRIGLTFHLWNAKKSAKRAFVKQ